MESKTTLSDVAEKIFMIEFVNGVYPDGYIEEHPYYKGILNHVVKNCKWGKSYYSDKTNDFNTPDGKTFDTAIKLIAMNFALWEQHSDLRFSNIERKIERTLEEQLKANEVGIAYEYWVSDKKWSYLEGEHYDYLTTDGEDEMIRVETATESIKNAIEANFELQIERLRTFLYYQTDRSFWYKLLNSKSETTDIYIDAILG